MDADLVKALISAAPIMFSPVVAWILRRSAVSTQAARLDYLTKRLDLIRRLQEMRSNITDDQVARAFESEVPYCESFLSQKPLFVRLARAESRATFGSILERFFLSARIGTIREQVFKGLFYFFFLIAVAAGVLEIALAIAGQGELGGWFPTFIYGALALICRALAKPRESSNQALPASSR